LVVSKLEITESSSFGAKLVVGASEFKLVFPFVGLDPRYNKFRLIIKGDMLDRYICALQKNWQTFQLMRTAMPTMAFTFESELGMKVTHQGVFLHMLCVASEAELSRILKAFQHARTRGNELRREIRMRGEQPPT